MNFTDVLHGRIWSRLELIEHDAAASYTLLTNLGALKQEAKQLAKENVPLPPFASRQDSGIYKLLVSLRICTQKLELTRPTNGAIDRLVDGFVSGKIDGASDLLEKLRALELNLRDDLGGVLFLHLPGKDAMLFHAKPWEFFGQAVYDKLIPVRYDMEEALKCCALERHTASVGHLTKVIEQALRELGVKVLKRKAYKADGITPKEWNNVSKDIKGALMGLNAKTKAARKMRDDRLLALDRFENVKHVRNTAHHPDVEYNEKEARAMLDHTKAFLDQVVPLI